MPPATGMAGPVVGSHARALAVKTLCIPTGRRALLVLLIELDDVSLPELPKRSLNEFIEPGNRRFPALEFCIPFGFVALFAANPLKVVRRVRNAQQYRLWANLAIYNRHHCLAPDFTETRVLSVHRLVLGPT